MSSKMLKLVASLQIYIHARKGIQVQIRPPTNIKQLKMLNLMSAIATKWLTKEMEEVELIKQENHGK